MPKEKFIFKKLSIDLPYPPSVNNAYRVWNGRILLSETGRKYQKGINIIWALFKRKSDVVEFGKDRLRVTVFVYPPDERRRDLDNLGKLLLDGLEKAGVYENDSQIDGLFFIRCWSEESGRVNVTIRNIKPSHLLKTKPFDGKRGRGCK